MRRVEVKINSSHSPARTIVKSSDNGKSKELEMQKLATNYKRKSSEKKESDTWKILLTNILNSQRGKIPLLLAVEAGNQSMVRELLSSQTAEQLKVCENMHGSQSVAAMSVYSNLFESENIRQQRQETTHWMCQLTHKYTTNYISGYITSCLPGTFHIQNPPTPSLTCFTYVVSCNCRERQACYDSEDVRDFAEAAEEKLCLFVYECYKFHYISSAKDLASLKLIDKLVSICSINKRDYVRLLLYVSFFKTA